MGYPCRYGLRECDRCLACACCKADDLCRVTNPLRETMQEVAEHDFDAKREKGSDNLGDPEDNAADLAPILEFKQ